MCKDLLGFSSAIIYPLFVELGLGRFAYDISFWSMYNINSSFIFFVNASTQLFELNGRL